MYRYYVGFFRNRDNSKIFAKAIRDIEDIDYNHVEIIKVNIN